MSPGIVIDLFGAGAKVGTAPRSWRRMLIRGPDAAPAKKSF